MTLTAKQFFSQASPVTNPSIENAFISGLKMRNGTFKKTSPSRFLALETPLSQALSQDKERIREVLDIGISIGQTTIELADFLSREGFSVNITGTDLFIDAHLIDVSENLHVLTDAEGWPLQYGYLGRPFRPWSSRMDYITLAAVPRALAKRMLRKTLKRKIELAQTRSVKLGGQALKAHNITCVENDIFTRTASFTGKFDFIRAANILNKGCFEPSQLRVAVGNMKAYLSGPGAYLLVVRTIKSDNDGTLFKLGEDGFLDPVKRFRRGSEIEAMIQSHCAVDPEA